MEYQKEVKIIKMNSHKKPQVIKSRITIIKRALSMNIYNSEY